MSGETPEKPLEYYVLKDSEMFGPFGEDELRAGLAEGRFLPTDFVQTDNQPSWEPLGRLLDPAGEEVSGAIAPNWRCILNWAWRRLCHNLGEDSAPAGVVCLAAGTAVLFLSRWPFLFWIPWFTATTVAAIALIRRKREAHGTVLLVGVVCVPMLFLILGSKKETAKSVPSGAREVVETLSTPASTTSTAAVPVKAPATTPAAARESPKAPEFPTIPGLVLPATAAARVSSTPAPPAIAVAAGNVTSSGPTPLSTVPSLPPVATAPIAPASQPQYASVPGGPVGGTAVNTSAGGEPLQIRNDAFVIVKGADGSGSGFICRQGNQTWLFTNIHVVADIKQPSITRLDNVAVTPGEAEAGAGPDIVRFALAQSPPHPLEAMTDFDNNVRIGDEVMVLGNSGGGGVVTQLKGAVVGIGPDRLEVSAEFIPGNSGSPIIHMKSGRVIGIATYLTRRSDQFSKDAQAGTGAVVIRRFGYRIDTVQAWEPINWAMLYNEADQIKQIARLTDDIVDFLGALRGRKDPEFATDTLRRPATDWLAKIREKRVSENDRRSATQGFLNALRAMVRSDVTVAEARVRYSYFRNKLKDEERDRDGLYKAFDAECAEIASPSNRRAYR